MAAVVSLADAELLEAIEGFIVARGLRDDAAEAAWSEVFSDLRELEL